MKTTNEVRSTFLGHVIHCIDEDSRDEYNVEVLINEKLEGEEFYNACYHAAAKTEIVNLSGNSFSYEYIQPSGKIVMVTKVVTVTREVLSPTDPESEKLLEQHTLE